MINNNLNIGAALIVKNNQSTITDTLNSIIPVCSQIVVVDTGSYDNTPQICTRLGAEVFFYKWVDDFSAARNYALKFLRTDWILSIDSDEQLDWFSLARYSDIITDDKVGGISIKIENFLDKEDLSNRSFHRYTRLFRNNLGFKYDGRVHEQISESIISSGLDIIESEIVIRHYGYQEVTTDKVKRNQDLLLKDIMNSPNYSWKIYHLAAAEFAGKNFSEAKSHFKQVVSSVELTTEQQEISRLRLAQIALRDEDFASINQWTRFVSNDTDREGFRKYILATAYLIQKNFTKAYSLFQSEEVIMSSLVNKTQLKKIFGLLQVSTKSKLEAESNLMAIC